MNVINLNGVKGVTTGDSYTCARLADGTVECWGYNYYGQIGSGDTQTPVYPQAKIQDLSNVTTVAAKWEHTCALLADQTAKCWGQNSYGALGNGTLVDSSHPVVVSGLSRATAITVGLGFSCALLSDKTVSCWGSDGTSVLSTTPTNLAGLSSVKEISSGASHTCALMTDETVKCWGLNLYGQLGDGTNTNRASPVAVVGLSGVKSISAGTSVRLKAE